MINDEGEGCEVARVANQLLIRDPHPFVLFEKMSTVFVVLVAVAVVCCGCCSGADGKWFWVYVAYVRLPPLDAVHNCYVSR